jgi:hypothetical protein
MKSLILSAVLFSSGCAMAQEGMPDDYSYQLEFPLFCVSTDEFMEILSDEFKPVIEFMPPEELQSEFSSPSYIFMNSDGEFFITMPADVPEDICFAQRGIVNRINEDSLLNFLGYESI